MDCRGFDADRLQKVYKDAKGAPTSGNAFQQQSRKLAYFLAGLGAL